MSEGNGSRSLENFSGRLEIEMNRLVNEAGLSTLYDISINLSPLLAQVELLRRSATARADGLIPALLDVNDAPRIIPETGAQALWADHLGQVRWLANATAAKLTKSPCESLTLTVPPLGVSVFHWLTSETAAREQLRLFLYREDKLDQFDKLWDPEPEGLEATVELKFGKRLPSIKETVYAILHDGTYSHKDSYGRVPDDVRTALKRWEAQIKDVNWSELDQWSEWLAAIGVEILNDSPDDPPSSNAEAPPAGGSPLAYTRVLWNATQDFRSVGIPDELAFNDGCPAGQVKKVRLEFLRHVVQPAYRAAAIRHLDELLETTKLPTFHTVNVTANIDVVNVTCMNPENTRLKKIGKGLSLFCDATFGAALTAATWDDNTLGPIVTSVYTLIELYSNGTTYLCP